MAVFEYRGILVSTGKTVQGLRDAENMKALRSQLRKDGILLTTASEEAAAQEAKKGNLDLKKFFNRVNVTDIAITCEDGATVTVEVDALVPPSWCSALYRAAKPSLLSFRVCLHQPPTQDEPPPSDMR